MKEITDLPGIGKILKEKFAFAGIHTVQELLDAAATKQARAELAKESGIKEERLLLFVKIADLSEIRGIGLNTLELLVKAGILSTAILQNMDAKKLHHELTQFNRKKKISKSIPGVETLERFIEEVRSTPSRVQS